MYIIMILLIYYILRLVYMCRVYLCVCYIVYMSMVYLPVLYIKVCIYVEYSMCVVYV